ncbi:OB-fold domain-containing protein [Rhodococcus pyridinivorans]|uniref:OB-fold domain-containing protein n=1 Tax=Rhodococcus pyridinivorans TaxID=103816 RepID=UPI002226EDF7|nr:OB-fold domain-containing protein [Rhodococcus pyridinivorans]MCW3472646.1 OB-fold domain-containing protein [Rhodococcus pyridinivorans]
MLEPRSGIVSYAAHLPVYRLARNDIAAALRTSAGKGDRIVASFDEDSTTLGVAAARVALRGHAATAAPVFFATTTPAYCDKTNATAVHAALGLPETGFAADLCGAPRSGVAAMRFAQDAEGVAVMSDVIVGRPGSADESGGGDGAAAFVFGPVEQSIAVLLGSASLTEEFLDRWRAPGAVGGNQWEERFGYQHYAALIDRVVKLALADADIDHADHVVVVSSNSAVAKKAKNIVPGHTARGSSIGYAGTAGIGVALADALDRAKPQETILLISASDGADALVLQVTDRIDEGRQPRSVAAQLEGGHTVDYPTYLTWRGLIDREPPRRPEPERVSGPAAARNSAWKFGLNGSRCSECGFVHLPPARVCKECGAADRMTAEPIAGQPGVVATYTIDRLAYSPAPPVAQAVVDFDDGGRFTFEVADADPAALEVGARVETVFRRLNSAAGVHNYFWKVRVL